MTTSSLSTKITTGALPGYKANFLQTYINGGVLRFGTFELKSKRVPPYFFNVGLFHFHVCHIRLSSPHFVTENPQEFDVVFGPAYKGVPLAIAAAARLAEPEPSKFGCLSCSFNRKEVKDHGEGGNIVGCSLKGKRVVMVDDVITTGTAIREAINLIECEGSKVVAIIATMDRMGRITLPDGEGFTPGPGAVGQIKKQYGVPALAILTLDKKMDGVIGPARWRIWDSWLNIVRNIELTID
ncbi:hypothetical protein FGG08_001589 [Glutinoglossum americanum]|uniref:Orotate phosphoribosyltransferase n=1 Tax=Glutinoglossum americanum TaxID=1670608 RepID=A0A9P8IDD7_9PEZI|nr:hypothetical protein FGG08_001589 [Glutinoglossum americanum]